MEDTIVAISTSVGEGAISIIRLSGHDALNIASKVFTKDLTKVDSHTIHYGFITSNNEKIDEVLVSVMKAPKTFTREDIVEINCHGGIATTNKVLEVLLENGARLAEPGEFTKRAFLNGRIDLLEAEATMDLISSKAESARKISINTLTGETSNLIKNLRSELVKIISNIEVNIDYPEYEDIEVLTNESILPDIKKFKEKLEEIIKKSEDSKVIKEGIRVGIIGRPNVGKSSLLNSLLEEEKAIVTDVPGTTRDIVEGSLIVSGIPLNIIDTAGIRKTEDTVEKIGVEKSLKIIDTSDLLIYILNNNEEITEEEKEILEKTKNKNIKVGINTVVSKLNVDKLEELGEFLDNYQIEKWKFLKFMPIRERAEKNEKEFEVDESILENSIKNLKVFKNIKKVEYKKQSEFEKSIVIIPNGDILQTQNGKDHYFGNALKEEIIDFDKIFSNGKIRTLVAYNDESVRENIINLIKGLEYVDLVGVATNGNDAYNKIIDLKPEMVFAGYNMPDINGLEIAIKTKENKNIETPIFNIFNDKNDIPEQELQKTINVIGNKLNALIQEPYENRVEDIIKDYKEYKYKK